MPEWTNEQTDKCAQYTTHSMTHCDIVSINFDYYDLTRGGMLGFMWLSSIRGTAVKCTGRVLTIPNID